MKRVTFTRHPVGGDRRFYVLEDDVRRVLGRLPKGAVRPLARVRFDDVGWATYQAGYASPGGRELALCALPPRVSLTRFLRKRHSPAEFGAVRGSQWPPRAVRRYQLYHVLLRELARLRLGGPGPEIERQTDEQRRALWRGGGGDGVHAPPSETERAEVAEHWEPAHAAYKRALLDEREGHVERAREGYRSAVERFPDHALAREALARAALEEGHPEAAVPHLRAALAADPALPDAHLWLARAALELEDRATARRAFEAAEVLHPQPAVVLALHAEALASWGESEAAEARFKKALRKAPENELVQRGYAAFRGER